MYTGVMWCMKMYTGVCRYRDEYCNVLWYMEVYCGVGKCLVVFECELFRIKGF